MNTNPYISQAAKEISNKLYFDAQMICYNRFEDEGDNNAIFAPDSFDDFERWLKSEVRSEGKYQTEDVDEFMRQVKSFNNHSVLNSVYSCKAKIEKMNAISLS